MPDRRASAKPRPSGPSDLRPALGCGTTASVPTWTALPRGYQIVLAANLAFCVTGLVVRQLPSWRMFESIPDPRHVMTDGAGRALRAEDYMPRDAYSFRQETLVNIAIFACQRGDVTPPITLQAGDRRFRIERDGERCVSREQPDAGH